MTGRLAADERLRQEDTAAKWRSRNTVPESNVLASFRRIIRTEMPQSVVVLALINSRVGGVMCVHGVLNNRVLNNRILKNRVLKVSLAAAAMVSAPLAANAADSIPAPVYRGAPPLIPLTYNWSGFYVGGHVGLGWTSDGNSDTGLLGGGQAGFNYQIGQWVLGAEGQVSATSIKNTASATFIVPGVGVGSASAEAKLDWLSTFAARAGWAFDRWLVYGKLGGAWAHSSATATAIMGGMSASVSADKTFSGWMLGLGTEYALWDNWTANVEYNRMDFGNNFGSDSAVNVVKAGVNYHFGLGPHY